MRVLTRLLRKSIILGLAALGAYKAWELAQANMESAREKADAMKNRIRPAVQEAQSEMTDASREAVAGVADAVADAARSGSTAGGSAESVHPTWRTA